MWVDSLVNGLKMVVVLSMKGLCDFYNNYRKYREKSVFYKLKI